MKSIFQQIKELKKAVKKNDGDCIIIIYHSSAKMKELVTGCGPKYNMVNMIIQAMGDEPDLGVILTDAVNRNGEHCDIEEQLESKN
ncbi:MAG: hypothetical protein ACUZ8H_16365 [Candidatus Anammoxibacter sp.]